MNIQECIDLYANMAGAVLPCTFVFGACNLLINCVLNAFFNGRLKFGGKI